MNLLDLVNTYTDIKMVDAFLTANNKIKRYRNIVCSLSGGSDSDIVLDILSKLDSNKKINYVFFNTGLEYNATLEHLDLLEKKYNVVINRERANKPIPTTCRKYGVPFLSKHVSEMVYRLQKHNFKWEDKPYEELLKEYPKCKSALGWWCNKKVRRDGKIGFLNIDRDKYLKEFMVKNPPSFRISQKCCTYAKKNVAESYLSTMNADLQITGIRKSEGGVRASTYKTCFTPGNDIKIDNYRPIFWFTNETKKNYELTYNVEHSRCYSEYGLTRTGCVGCPFNSKFEDEISRVETYEPNLYKAINKIFGESYDYTRRYREYKAARELEDANKNHN